MPIESTGNIHINHQFQLSSKDEFLSQRNRRFNMTQNEFDDFNLDLQNYLNQTNIKQSRNTIIDWVKRESPVAAITMVFNCSITHSDSIDLLNRFYDQLCKYQFGRTYKKRNQLVTMFAFLENAVRDKNKQGNLKHEDCNHFHLILCNPMEVFGEFESIQNDIESARIQANKNYRKAFKAQVLDASFIPQIARCKVQNYFNTGKDDLENYVTKNLEKYSREHDLKFDQLGYPSTDGFIFGEKIF